MKAPTLQMILENGSELKLEQGPTPEKTALAVSLGPGHPFFADDLEPSQLRPLIEWLEARESALIQAGKLSAVRA